MVLNDSQVRVLKRYRNRRLYDPETRQQVTLAFVRGLVNKGADFRVVDNTSGQDVTVAVLVQVLGEDARGWRDWDESTRVLRLLIQRGGDAGMAILSKTVLAAIGALAITRENAEKWVDELIRRGELDKSKRAEAIKEAAARAEVRAKETAQKVGKKVSDAYREVKEQGIGKRFAKSAEVAELKRTVDELTAKLEELRAKLG